VDSEVIQRHHTVKDTMGADVNATNIWVHRFEITKPKSSSAMENVTILSGRMVAIRKYTLEVTIFEKGITYDHMRNAHGKL
jgi:hypothetical protein